jgi:ACR3 family arsenite efflux pump ArsB
MSEQIPPPEAPAAPPPPYAPPAPVGYGPIGKVRSTGLCFLWIILTIGIYGFFWMGYTHAELKRHTGQGIGGPLAVVIWLFVSPVMFFLTPHEVGNMQERAGRPRTLSALWGLWILLPLIGPIVWFVKVNGEINEYWKSLGAQ